MNKVIDVIQKRRSVRVFEDKKINNDLIEILFRAGMQAPSGSNQQAWHFIAVKKPELLDQIGSFKPYANFVKNAPLAIVVLGDKEIMKSERVLAQDLSAATENILLQATAMGLGATWVCIAPKVDWMQDISKLLDLADKYIPFCIIGMGYPKYENANHFIDRFDENKCSIIE